MKTLNLFILLIIMLLFLSCTEKISYSGKIYKKEDINYNDFNTKKELINNLGNPSYIDPIENKYYYFTEKFIETNFYENKIDDRSLIVFNFNDNDSIISINKYDLSDQKKTKIIEDSIQNNLLEQGLLEKIFGGIAKGVPTTTQNY